jgi:hypothetical protein
MIEIVVLRDEKGGGQGGGQKRGTKGGERESEWREREWRERESTYFIILFMVPG